MIFFELKHRIKFCFKLLIDSSFSSHCPSKLFESNILPNHTMIIHIVRWLYFLWVLRKSVGAHTNSQIVMILGLTPSPCYLKFISQMVALNNNICIICCNNTLNAYFSAISTNRFLFDTYPMSFEYINCAAWDLLFKSRHKANERQG